MSKDVRLDLKEVVGMDPNCRGVSVGFVSRGFPCSCGARVRERHTLMGDIAFAMVRLALGFEVEGRKLLAAILELLADGKIQDGQLVKERRVTLLRELSTA